MTGTRLRLAGFAVAVLAAFGAAWAVGGAIDSIRPPAEHPGEHR